MIRYVLIEVSVLLLVTFLVGWGCVKLYHLIKSESAEDRKEARRLKREAQEALDDLENAVEREKKNRP